MSNKTQRCNRHMEFNVSDIFRVIPGKRITREFAARHSGDIGVVKSGCDNKGVMCYMSKDSGYTESYMEDCGISLAGKFVYYHDRPIFLNDGAVGLKMLAKEYESKYTYIFLTVIMRKWAMESRFQQSYATTEKKVVESQLKLRLPVDDNGNQTISLWSSI